MSCKFSTSQSINKFNAVAKKTEQNLEKNPFSDNYKIQKFNSNEYGRPPPGSKTEARGIKAGVHVCREILFLCETIDENAKGEDPHKWISFGTLFAIYSLFSGSLVGMLIRARKYGLLHFEGEMLYQREDDDKKITMLMPLSEIRQCLTASGDPANCVSIKRNSIATTFVPENVKPIENVERRGSASIELRKQKFEDDRYNNDPVNDDKNIRKKKWKPPISTNSGPVFCT